MQMECANAFGMHSLKKPSDVFRNILRMCFRASDADAAESYRRQSRSDKPCSESVSYPALVPPYKFRIVGSDKCHPRMELRRVCMCHRSSLRIRY
jgi:hypothetical protein